MKYEEWNTRLARHFFNHDNAYKEVIMYVNRELINKLGSGGEQEVEDFVNAIKEGPAGVTRSGMCQKAKQLFEGWRDRELEFPPYIAYLSFFVLAAGTGGDFASHAYYPRLWTLLREEQVGPPPSFDQMGMLWEDLETWSQDDKNEELGKFVVRIRLKWVHVGIPFSQTLCSREELDRLPILFDKAYLDPTNPPVPENMARLIRMHGGEVFKPRTLEIFNRGTNESAIYVEALTNLVLEELENWDGTRIEPHLHDGKRTTRTGSGLRICIHYDSTSKEVNAYLRFKARVRFPEEEVKFTLPGTGNIVTCSESKNGWSTSIRKVLLNSYRRLDASEIDWVNGIKLVDNENNWTVTLHPAKTRVFEEGLEGLKDWIEVKRIERGTKYIIASYGDEASKIAEWGTESAVYFKEEAATGIPHGWKLFLCKDIRESCKDVEVLTVSTRTNLKLSGGIRSRRSATYFDFAPPVVMIENGTGDEGVYINGERVESGENGKTFKLPLEKKYTGPIKIVAMLGKNVIGSRTIRLESFDTLPEILGPPCRNQKGDLIDSYGDRTLVIGAIAPEIPSSSIFSPQLPYHLSDHIIFIGRSPGEVLEWSSKSSAQEWKPIWAIARISRKNWEVHYCGGPVIDLSRLKPAEPLKDKRARKKWKEVVYVNRKNTRKPQLRILESLWRQYMEAAHHV